MLTFTYFLFSKLRHESILASQTEALVFPGIVLNAYLSLQLAYWNPYIYNIISLRAVTMKECNTLTPPFSVSVFDTLMTHWMKHSDHRSFRIPGMMVRSLHFLRSHFDRRGGIYFSLYIYRVFFFFLRTASTTHSTRN